MDFNLLKILVIFTTLVILTATGSISSASTYLSGSAELGYTNYEADVSGEKIFKGDSLVQQYSLAWTTTNLVHRNQPRYYTLTAGYNWTGFNTKATDKGIESTLKDSYGKFIYNGEVAFSPAEFPIRFRAYTNDNTLPRRNVDIYQDLLADGLTYNLEGRGIFSSSGFTFVFDPSLANTANLRALPRLHVDYRESRSKATDKFTRTDNLTRELAVAGLNKENNWLHYRRIKYEDFTDVNNGYEQQQVQIGLVDHVGRRKWSPLTNWIMVSADGQLTDRKSLLSAYETEEYDINLQAIASRRMWQGRTFMNYNRIMESSRITEQIKIPLYFNGLWGADSDWYFRVSAERGNERVNADSQSNFYSNSISAGFTTFKRSTFLLTPTFTLKTDKTLDGFTSYEGGVTVGTESTKRYSDKSYLSAVYEWSAKDDGRDLSGSKTWRQLAAFKWKYRANSPFAYELTEKLENANGNGYINSARAGILGGNVSNNSYVRSTTYASVAYLASSAFSASADANYDLVMMSNLPDDKSLRLSGRMLYNRKDISYNFYVNYENRDNGIDVAKTMFSTNGEVQYKPDRYQDGLLRFKLEKENNFVNTTNSELLQRYTRNFFNRTGVINNFATISQELSFKRLSGNGTNYDTKYLLLSGRYSPTSRLSLYGYVKYQSDPGAVSMFYNAGMQANFKLLTTSLDYTLAKRDTDNRTERKIAANVRRAF